MSIWIDRSVEYGDIKRLRQTFRVDDEQTHHKERLIDEDGNVIEDAAQDGLVIERFTSAEALERLFSCNGEPLLTVAIESNQVKSLEVLLEIHLKYAITLDLKNKKTGQTALHAIAAKVPASKSKTETISDNNNNEQQTKTNTHHSGRGRGRGRGGMSHPKSSKTPSSVRETTSELVKKIMHMLLDAGAFSSPKDNKGRTPLHIAMEMKNVDVIRILIENGACVTIADKQNRKPLDYFLLFANGLKLQKEEPVLQQEYEEMKQLVNKARCIIQTKKTRNNVIKEKNNTKNLFYAITKCDLNATRRFLEKGALVNGVSSRGLSPIYLACKHGYKEILDLLVSFGGNLRINNVRSTTPLHAACEHQHAHIVKYILDTLRTEETSDDDNNNSVECTMLHIRDSDNKQPIDIAMKHNNMEIIDLLLPLHMKYEQYYGIGNIDNPRWNWYLREACKIGNLNIASRLLAAKCVNVNRATRGGWTPLHISVRFGHMDITTILLNHGADPNLATEPTKWTPLHVACELENEDLKCQMIGLLLQHGAGAVAATSTAQTALHMLVRKGQLRPVQVLAKADDLDIGATDYNNWSPVDIALKNKHLEIMGFLLSCGATISSFPLFNACRGDNNELVAQMLKSEDIDINFSSGTNQWSILGISVLKGISVDIISMMLDRSANVDYVNLRGYTALHTAVSMNRADVVELLCAKGKADVNIPNQHQRFPLHTAILLNNGDIVSSLLRHGANPDCPYPTGNTPLQAALMTFHTHNNSKKQAEDTIKVAEAIVVTPAPVPVRRGRGGLRGAPARGRGGRGLPRGRGAARGRGRGGRANWGMEGTAVAVAEVRSEPVTLGASVYRPTLSVDPEAKRQNNRIIDLLIQYGANINASITGFTMLHSAVHLLEYELVKAILDHGGDANFPSKHGITPLVSLAMMLKGTDRDFHKIPKILAILRELLSHGADPNVTNAVVGRTPLMYAVDNNCFEFAQILLQESKPDVNKTEKHNWTALQIAVDKKSFVFTKLLIEHGADPTHQTNGWTPLHMAILKDQKEIVRYLVEQCNVDVNIETRIGTPLAVATKKNQLDGMKYLLQKGAKTGNLLDAKQRLWTILHESAKEGNLQIIQILTEAEVSLDCQDSHGWTALHVAVSRNRLDIVRYLLQNGADATITTDAGWQPIHTAVKTLPGKKHYSQLNKVNKVQKFDNNFLSESCFQIIKLLLARVSNVNATLPSGSTALDLAIACNNGVACSLLLEKRDANNNPIAEFLDTKTKFDEHWSPLHYAAVRNLYNIVVPFSAFHDVNATDKNNCTPAIIAAKRGHHHVIDALVQAGADLTMEDNEGKTALFWATKIRRKKAVKSLAHAAPEVAYQQDDEGNRAIDIASQKPKRGNISTLLKNIVEKSYQEKEPQIASWGNTRKAKDNIKNNIKDDLKEFRSTGQLKDEFEAETLEDMPSDYDLDHLWIEPEPPQEELDYEDAMQSRALNEYYQMYQWT